MPAERRRNSLHGNFFKLTSELKKIPLHTGTAISCNSIKKKKKEEEIVPFERISCLSPELAWSLAHASYEDENIEVCLE